MSSLDNDRDMPSLDEWHSETDTGRRGQNRVWNLKKALTLSLIIVLGGLVAIIVWATTKNNPDSSAGEISDDSKPDYYDTNGEDEGENELLFDGPFFNNPSTTFVEGSLRLYERFLLSEPTNVTYSVSIDFGENSGINSAFDKSGNADEKHTKRNGRSSLCFTDNLFLLELNIKNDDDIHLKHPSDDILKQNVMSTGKFNNAMVTTSNHTLCVHNIDKLRLPLDLPPHFKPSNYGAVAIVHTDDDEAMTSSNPSSPGSLVSLGNLFYAVRMQRSMYPSITTELISTSEVYIISGDINVRGKVGRIGGTYDLYDKPVMRFEEIDLAPQPPALFLYLTTRSGWMRFGDDDIYFAMEGDGDITWPEGSFYEEGSFNMEWPLTDDRVDIRDYMEGYWYLWCTTFRITLAGGDIEVLSEY